MTTQRLIQHTFSSPDKPLVYVLRGKQGDLLIDTGYEEQWDELHEWIDSLQINLKWVFLTHGHFDHAGSAYLLRKTYGCEIIIHKDDALYLEGSLPRKFYPSSKVNARTSNLVNDARKLLICPSCQIDHCLSNSDTDFLRQRGFDADVVMLRGHTYGSMGIVQGRVLYCGDACAAKRGDYYTALFGEDLFSLHATERKIFEINPLIIAPGHGKFIINELAFPTYHGE